MELNELRHLWNQQSVIDSPTLSAQQMQMLLAQRSMNIVDRLRRSAWWESGFNALTLVLIPVALYYVTAPAMRALLYFMLISAVGLCYYYYCKLRVLRRMSELEQDIQAYLQVLVRSLRELLRVYFRLTMASVPISLGIVIAYESWPALQRKSGWWLLADVVILVGGYVLLLWLTRRTVREFAEWYTQRLYGQHLDRLEGYLQELQAE